MGALTTKRGKRFRAKMQSVTHGAEQQMRVQTTWITTATVMIDSTGTAAQRRGVNSNS